MNGDIQVKERAYEYVFIGIKGQPSYLLQMSREQMDEVANEWAVRRSAHQMMVIEGVSEINNELYTSRWQVHSDDIVFMKMTSKEEVEEIQRQQNRQNQMMQGMFGRR